MPRDHKIKIDYEHYLDQVLDFKERNPGISIFGVSVKFFTRCIVCNHPVYLCNLEKKLIYKHCPVRR